MSFFAAVLLRALVPSAVILGLWGVVFRGTRWLATGAGILTGGLAGVLGAWLASSGVQADAVGATLDMAAFLVCMVGLLFVAACGVIAVRHGESLTRTGHSPVLGESFAPLLAAPLVAQGVLATWTTARTHALTSTDIVNTQLIANSAAIVLSALLLVILTLVLRGTVRLAGGVCAAVVLAVSLILALVALSGVIVVDLLRLEAIDVTGGRISYAARLGLAEPWFGFVFAALLGVVALIAFLRRERAEPAGRGAARRLQLAASLRARRWRNALVGVAVLVAAVLAYQDFYASRPPSLSPAAPVVADAGGHVRIPVAGVKDGQLHRYAYITSAGHRVRFFLINKYDADHPDIGVVYDACMLCGDTGYIQQGDEIICVSCNVRIFRPSIGQAGGCNPIPLPHEIDSGTIVISADELEKGASHFPEIVEVTVSDPVTGVHLVNTKAPFQYEFRKRTYFFTTRDSYDTFRKNPAAYSPGGAAARSPGGS